MKGLLVFAGLAILAGACGRSNAPTGDASLNQLRSFAPAILSEPERNQLAQLCQALAQKAQGLSVAPPQNLQFQVQERPCGKAANLEGIVAQPVAAVTEVQSPGTYRIRRSDKNLEFVFPDLETNSTGSMAAVCSDLGAQAQNPRRLGNGNSLWVSTLNADPAYCNPKTNEVCVQLETGIQEANGERIIKREFMRFQMDNTLPRFGFWVEREVVTTALCGTDLNSQVKARLVP